jgi:tetraacyldisaccharide 4'-kinase
MNRFVSLLEQSWRKMAYEKRGRLRFAAPVLLPLSWLYGMAGSIRRELYRANVLKKNIFPIPILSIGNLTVGGVGKTPFALFLAQQLHHQGYHPAILLRGYGRKSHHPVVILPGEFKSHSVVNCGDEPSLLAFLSAFPIAVSPERAVGVRRLLDETDADVILLDDGFQHLQLNRDMDLVLLDGSNPLGNGHCLPYGPLREPRSALRSAHALIVNGAASERYCDMFQSFCNTFFFGGLEWSGLYPLENWMDQKAAAMLTVEKYKHMPVTLVSGVGSPERLYKQAQANGLPVHRRQCYPDHHWFSVEDLHVLAILSRSHPIVMTEKDAIRLFAHSRIPGELAANSYVIQANWRMQNPEGFDKWLRQEMSSIASPLDVSI